MVVWSSYYSFCAEEVEALGTSDSGNGTHPFVLTVYLRSGRQLSVSYADTKSRNAAMLDLNRKIEGEKKQNAKDTFNAEKMLCTLYLIRNTIERMDKRQLRIWKQLKTLLGVNVEE